MLRTILTCAVLIGLTIGVYRRAIGFGLSHLDDPTYIEQHHLPEDQRYVQKGLTPNGIRWAFTTTDGGNWHPATWISLMLDATVLGPTAQAWHIGNIVLHVANTLLLFGVLVRMTSGTRGLGHWPSALVAAWFALHPLHVESVAWISERKDVLSTFFWLLAMWAYVEYVRSGRRLAWYIATAVLLALGLMSKPMVVTLPFVFLLMDYWPLARHNLTTSPSHSFTFLIVEKLPLFALVALMCAVTLFAQRGSGAVAGILQPFALVNIPLAYTRYMFMMFWPWELAVYYPFPGALGHPSWQIWQIAGASVILLTITAITLVEARRRPYLIVGWLWFVGTLVPVIGLVRVGNQSIADRYTYVPLIGLFIMLAWLGAELAGRVRWLRAPLAAAGALSVVACAALTVRQVGFWANSETLYRHALDITHTNWRGHQLLGDYYALEGRQDEALTEYDAAQDIYPDEPVIYMRKAAALDKLGRLNDALIALARALELSPDDPDVHFNLAIILERLGRRQESRRHLDQAIHLNPAGADHYNQLRPLVE